MHPLEALDPRRFETPAILKQLAAASRRLAELKGLATSIPRQGILINTLSMQEAKDSSEIENIITSHDELFQDDLAPSTSLHAAAKEVQHYRQALKKGFELVRENQLLTNNHLLAIQSELEQNRAGFRKLPGTMLKNSLGETVYTPPQDANEIVALMQDLERFINDDMLFDADPLIKMALIHHRFESIHPFYDGNGRTGRILNVLYLVKARLLEIPILYLSRYIVQTKAQYYHLLQLVRTDDAWESWVLYMLVAVEQTAGQAIQVVEEMKAILLSYKHEIRKRYPRIYSQDLINNLFIHPYTKIEFVERDLSVSRLTATKYLDTLTEAGFLEKQRIGRVNYYINHPLVRILTSERMQSPAERR